MAATAKSQTLKNSHPTPKGRTIIARIENQMDKRRRVMERLILQHGYAKCAYAAEYVIQKGRYEGLAAALSLLRSSSVAHEIERSNERLGIE